MQSFLSVVINWMLIPGLAFLITRAEVEVDETWPFFFAVCAVFYTIFWWILPIFSWVIVFLVDGRYEANKVAHAVFYFFVIESFMGIIFIRKNIKDIFQFFKDRWDC